MCVLYWYVNVEIVIVCVWLLLIGDVLQVFVYVKDCFDLFVGICVYFDCNGLLVFDVCVSMMWYGYVFDNFIVMQIECDVCYCDIVNFVEQQFVVWFVEIVLLLELLKGCLLRLFWMFLIMLCVDLWVDECGQYYILFVLVNDWLGFFYLIVCVFVEYWIGVYVVWINMFGECVEDIFLFVGVGLFDNCLQIQFEIELLCVIVV